MVLEYAKEKSDRVAKLDGTYVPKAKRQKVVKETVADDDAAPEEEKEAGGQSDNVNALEQESEMPQAPSAPASKYLLAQDLPSECNDVMLAMLFQQYAGYKEVRMPRPGLAFVEFENEAQATLALEGLNGFKLTTKDSLKLTYGKA